MTSKHTPGPWYVGKGGEAYGYVGRIFSDNPTRLIAQTTVPSGDDLRGHVQTLANARLMAEAPAMLEALRGLIQSVRKIQADKQLEATTDGLGILFGDVLAERLEKAEAILARIDGEA